MTNLYRYYPPRVISAVLSEIDDVKVMALWKAKRDTYAIALQLGLKESQVANRLAVLRDQSVASCVSGKTERGESG